MAQGTSWLDTRPPEQVEGALARMREHEPSRRYIEEVGGGDERFALWLSLVDMRLTRQVGIGHRDLSDWHWRDAYEGGMPPLAASREALAADDTFAALFGGQ